MVVQAFNANTQKAELGIRSEASVWFTELVPEQPGLYKLTHIENSTRKIGNGSSL